MIARILARAFAVLLVGAVSVTQWVLTSPGVVTDLEFRTLLLVAAPALVTILSARWVSTGASLVDPRGGDVHASHRRPRQ